MTALIIKTSTGMLYEKGYPKYFYELSDLIEFQQKIGHEVILQQYDPDLDKNFREIDFVLEIYDDYRE